jgi:hypothetical protein
MAKLSISDAARVSGVSRVTLHRYIKAGRLSRLPDGSIDTAELVRAGFVLHLETLTDDTPVTPVLLDDTATPVTPSVTPPVAADTHAYERMIALLQQQVDEYRGRERYYQDRIAWLETQVGHEQYRYDRLLEAPRTAPVADTTTRTAPAAHEAPRGEIRRRIVALLQDSRKISLTLWVQWLGMGYYSGWQRVCMWWRDAGGEDTGCADWLWQSASVRANSTISHLIHGIWSDRFLG